ncbi:uncharacterized protein LOC119630132 [Bombyx mori]|uniref:Uncharacterized protein n=1 Tax=Bombyx mori TaxID=7091 RepID=A0A8R2M4Q4_BOMMO|nr:uncharacterized protein LOC119630132 [Bombyx mori]XP_037874552.1 uncharacterized protein LOC119630132 [Bombyx mori]
MELMSPLLFYAILLPTALGRLLFKPDWEPKLNHSIKTRHNPTAHKKLLLNFNGIPLVNVISELQLVFNDVNCQKCTDCMERAVKAFIINQHIISSRPNLEDFQNDVLYEKLNINRNKRDANKKVDAPNEKNTNKVKTKRTKANKITVTKYDVDGEVYALKVHETIHLKEKANNTITSCHVYGVKKSFPCETPEANSIVINLTRKRKANKTKKIKEKTIVVGTTNRIPAMFRKRQLDDSQIPEHFRTSIEDFY